MKVRDERIKEMGASASGILLIEQSTPRHKDLEAGIWIGAVRRADSPCRSAAISQSKVIHQISTGRRVWVIGEAGNRERVRTPRQPLGWMPNSPLVRLPFRRVAGLGYRSSRRGRRFESGLRNQMPE